MNIYNEKMMNENKQQQQQYQQQQALAKTKGVPVKKENVDDDLEKTNLIDSSRYTSY